MQKEQVVAAHWQILGHKEFGVTEMRTFDPIPMTAYAENMDIFISLCLEMDEKTTGIYAGVQPRPAHLFDLAPNCWTPAKSGTNGNCACDNDIEFITSVFFDIDVVSDERAKGHPASEEELYWSMQAAELLGRENSLASYSTICCSGNGHYVLAPIVPVAVYSNDEAAKFKQFCKQQSLKIAAQTSNVRFDPVFNLSRVMRVIGTLNGKGQQSAQREHRRSYFVTEPVFKRSMALHHIICNIEIEEPKNNNSLLPLNLRCDLEKLEKCLFIQWCRKFPENVSEPLWWAMITNLTYLEGGIQLIHEISKLDKHRYDYFNTERVIQQIIKSGYRPVLCKTITSNSMACAGRGKFKCSIFSHCPARAPMFMAALKTI